MIRTVLRTLAVLLSPPYRSVRGEWLAFDAAERAEWAAMVEGASVKYGQQR